MLAVPLLWPPKAPCRPETQRRRNTAQDLRRERPAKAEQDKSLVEIDPRRRLFCERADRRPRPHMRESRFDRLNAPPQPTHGAGQCDLGSAKRIGGGLHALGGQCDSDAVFDRGQQAGPPRGKKVRQETERSTTLRAIPPGDPQPAWRRPGVTAMTSKRAAA